MAELENTGGVPLPRPGAYEEAGVSVGKLQLTHLPEAWEVSGIAYGPQAERDQRTVRMQVQGIPGAPAVGCLLVPPLDGNRVSRSEVLRVLRRFVYGVSPEPWAEKYLKQYSTDREFALAASALTAGDPAGRVQGTSEAELFAFITSRLVREMLGKVVPVHLRASDGIDCFVSWGMIPLGDGTRRPEARVWAFSPAAHRPHVVRLSCYGLPAGKRAEGLAPLARAAVTIAGGLRILPDP